jgi:hypothetical protein
MNNHMYMVPSNLPYDHTLNYANQDSRLWGGFGRPFFGPPFGFGVPFGFGFGFPFFGGFPFFI